MDYYAITFIQTIRDCNCAEGQCEAGDKYAEQLEDVIRFSMPKGKIGAFFAEAIQVNDAYSLQVFSSFLRLLVAFLRHRLELSDKKTMLMIEQI